MTRTPPRRHSPRQVSSALESQLDRLAPGDPLSQLQRAWERIVGAPLAARTEPTRALGDGQIVIRCDSGQAAHELQLMAPKIEGRAAKLLSAPVRLRFEGPAGKRGRR